MEPFSGPEYVLEMVPAFVTKIHFPKNLCKKLISRRGKGSGPNYSYIFMSGGYNAVKAYSIPIR